MNADFPERLSQRLHQPLPGPPAQRTMEAELSCGRNFGPPRRDARPAAVVAVLHQVDGQWHLPLMLRPDSLAHHAGQVSLPGGVMEPGESTDETALRELEEELGIARGGVLLLGQLSPLYVFGTNFLVFPCVAAVRKNLVVRPSAAEVQEVLQVPVAHLLDPASRGQHIHKRGNLQFLAPHFAWQAHRIWGATSMILAELTVVISDVIP